MNWSAWGVAKSLALPAGACGRYSLHRSSAERGVSGEFFTTPTGKIKTWSSRKEAQAFADKLNADLNTEPQP